MDYYGILGIPKKSGIDDIRKAYKKLALIYHPDKPTGDNVRFQKINDAYQFLNDKSKKALYDATIDMDENPDTLNELFSTLLDIFKQQFDIVKERKRKTPTTENPTTKDSTTETRKKVKPIIVKVNVTLDEVHRGDIKKVIVRVRREEKWQKEKFYVNLIEHKSKYIFSDMGDHMYGEKGDIEVQVKVLEHDRIKIDNILCQYDLYIEEDITLYEYVYGIDRDIKLFGDETVNVKRNPIIENKSEILNCVHVIEDYGLPYIMDNTIYNGNLYIYFRLVMKYDKEVICDENIKGIIKKCFNVNGESS